MIQQRAGVTLSGGVGHAGDRYERHADAVADAIVAGHSAEHLPADAHGIDRALLVEGFADGIEFLDSGVDGGEWTTLMAVMRRSSVLARHL